MNAVTINTVQGIGDLFWVYQKLAPHLHAINLNILCIDGGPVQTRARSFCSLLPKIAGVQYLRVNSMKYNRIAKSRFPISAVLRASDFPVDYAVNAPLEAGIGLRDIDPDFEILETVGLLGVPPKQEGGNYLCAFVAGQKGPTIWDAAQWAYAIARVAQRTRCADIVLIGAKWDAPVQAEVERELAIYRFNVVNRVARLRIEDTIGVIRSARFFVGFQSGLNVIAENYNVRQLMVYFDHLRPMMNTWCKPTSVGAQFRAMCFGDDIEPVLDAL